MRASMTGYTQLYSYFSMFLSFLTRKITGLQELRKEIKEQRPEDIVDFVIAYCHAKKDGDPLPSTVDPIEGIKSAVNNR